MTNVAVPEYQHRTVLLDEAVDALNIAGARADGIYIDGTFGRGGHSRLILSKLGAKGRLESIDQRSPGHRQIIDAHEDSVVLKAGRCRHYLTAGVIAIWIR